MVYTWLLFIFLILTNSYSSAHMVCQKNTPPHAQHKKSSQSKLVYILGGAAVLSSGVYILYEKWHKQKLQFAADGAIEVQDAPVREHVEAKTLVQRQKELEELKALHNQFKKADQEHEAVLKRIQDIGLPGIDSGKRNLFFTRYYRLEGSMNVFVAVAPVLMAFINRYHTEYEKIRGELLVAQQETQLETKRLVDIMEQPYNNNFLVHCERLKKSYQDLYEKYDRIQLEEDSSVQRHVKEKDQLVLADIVKCHHAYYEILTKYYAALRYPFPQGYDFFSHKIKQGLQLINLLQDELDMFGKLLGSMVGTGDFKEKAKAEIAQLDGLEKFKKTFGYKWNKFLINRVNDKIKGEWDPEKLHALQERASLTFQADLREGFY